ncbi:hypothetical protein A8F94_09590 [Bacillus sp. FJAT-27225]|uniref:phosphotransferase n=1 Tax=Bacillus sp. FJAT-27225 TaxID=1743144 RepID=UPI00080C2478|nr:phosphotransferase [Bacillus sp. FJAT-27225]OCA88063.1 hypothetical protein A8F94_09590 [Bacillus sp. FJAT-27225]
MQKNLIEALSDSLKIENNRILAESILQSTDPIAITTRIEEFCKTELGIPVARCLYVGFSVGASFGLVLEDGRKVFLKAHKQTAGDDLNSISIDTLTAVSEVQSHLATDGFPCPKVILPPRKFGEAIMTVDSYEDVGEQQDAHNPTIRNATAQAFAELIICARPLATRPGITRGRLYESRTLYPVPHNALFDFEKTAKGAEWIDEIALEAKLAAQSFKGETVLGHADWSLKNLRLKDDKVVMVYDWDSLAVDDELNLLGIAAATFPTTWDIDTKITPSREEVYLFVKEYERHRGRTFTKKELMKIAAAATYTMAYTARCEHALNPKGENFEGSFRQALIEMKNGFLID